MIQRGGNRDSIEWRAFSPTVVPIPLSNKNVVVIQSVQIAHGTKNQFVENLNRVNLCNQLRNNRRLITRTGSNLKHTILGVQLKIRHGECYNVGLRNSLTESNGQRAILVRAAPRFERDKFVPGHVSHCLQNSLVANTTAFDLGGDHFEAPFPAIAPLRRRPVKPLSKQRNHNPNLTQPREIVPSRRDKNDKSQAYLYLVAQA
jgi:hypothetical protein